MGEKTISDNLAGVATFYLRFFITVFFEDERCLMQFHNSTFENETVELDGHAYDHCDFKHCILVYRGGPPPRFAHCSFFQYAFRFDDAAGTTLSFLTSLYHCGFKTYIEQTFTNICTNRRGRPRATAPHNGVDDAVVMQTEEPSDGAVVNQGQ